MTDSISCAICGATTQMITPAHLRTHGITVAEYKIKYPDAAMASKSVITKREQSLKSAAINAGKQLSGRDKSPVDALDSVKCAICGKIAKHITPRHLAMHGTTMAEYRNMFPDHNLTNGATRSKVAKSKIGVYRGEDFSKAQSERKSGHQPEHLRGLMSPELAEKISVARMKHINAEAIMILNDPVALEALAKTRPVQAIANELGVSFGSVAKRLDRFGIPRPCSSVEASINNLIESLPVTAMLRTRKVIAPQELDLYIPEKNIAIEVCGLYWHSDKFLLNNYHSDKMNKCHDRGIRLLTIFEDEIVDRFDIVEARIKYFLGLGERGEGARRHVIRTIDKATANQFLDNHHIQGGSSQNHINYGSFVGEKLASVMSFRKSWRLSHEENRPYELARFATDGKNHPGIASKLFQRFVKDYRPNRVITYADRRWSEGELYRSMGFVQNNKKIPPSYFYINGQKRLDKSLFRKEKIQSFVPQPQGKTEREIMNEAGFSRIYDCGYLRFEWEK